METSAIDYSYNLIDISNQLHLSNSILLFGVAFGAAFLVCAILYNIFKILR